MFKLSYTKKWLENIEQEQAEIEKRLATSQTFSGRIRVNSDRLYLDPEEERKVLNELRTLTRE